MNNYSQFTAMLAVTKASFRSITRSPSAVVFTLLFPLIFILVFGFLENSGVKLDLGIHSGSNKSNEVFSTLKGAPGIHLIEDETDEQLYSDLEKGRIDAVLIIKLNPDSSGPKYFLDMQTSAASLDNGAVLKSVMENMVNKLNLKGAFTTSEKVVTNRTDPHQIGRFQVKNWDGDEFKSWIVKWTKSPQFL